MRPAGVTNHYSRIYTPNANAVSNETFMKATAVIGDNVLDAVDSVMTCAPDYLVMGMSAITFYGGRKGADEFQQKVQRRASTGVSIGSHATAEALRCYPGIKTIAFVSPYFPAANEQVRQYFEESGFSVSADQCLQCSSWTDIAKVPPEKLWSVLGLLDGPDVDALVQVGTNLPMAALAADAEVRFQKPVIAINTATYWHALRSNGVLDQMPAYGSLLREH